MQIHVDLEALPRFKNAVLTIGSFDGLHRGHMTLLDQLKKITSRHKGESIVITFDPHPRLVLENDPPNFALLTSMDEKISLLEKTGIDHLVIVPFTLKFAQQSAEAYLHDFLVRNFDPKAIVVGYDHRYGAGRIGDFDLMVQQLQPLDIEIVEIDPLLIEQIAISSSAIRRALMTGDIKKANEGLGYNFFIRGTVTHGDMIGRTLGFPTANLSLKEKHKAIPADGIYLASIIIGNNNYDGMAYIGHRPVLGEALARVIEVNIFDFEEDIYEKEIDLQLVEYIRGDMALSSLDELQTQLQRDKEAAIALRKNKSSGKITSTAVIVLNFNGVNYLKNFLPDLVQHTSDAEIIIADNGSTDGSVDFIETNYPQLNIIRFNENYGFTGGYNRAISEVNHEYVLLLNSDVRVSPGWIKPLVDLLDSNKSIAAVQPKILSEKFHSKFDYAGAAGGYVDVLGYPFCRGRIFDDIETDRAQYNDAQEVFWASGAAMLIRRELYELAGGLDEYFFAHMEEIDLAWRLKNMGYQVWVQPESVIYHLGGGTLDATSPHKTYLNFRNSLFVIVKNESSHLFFKILCRLCLDGVAGVRFILQGKFSFVIAILKAHLHFYLKLNHYLKQRKFNLNLINNHAISTPNNTGKWNRLIIWSYFTKGKKTFQSLDIK